MIGRLHGALLKSGTLIPPGALRPSREMRMWNEHLTMAVSVFLSFMEHGVGQLGAESSTSKSLSKGEIALFVVNEYGLGKNADKIDVLKQRSLKGLGRVDVSRSRSTDDRLADMAISLEALHSNRLWRWLVVQIASSLQTGGIFIIKEPFRPSWVPWIVRIHPGSTRDFTWQAFVDHCSDSGLELIAFQRLCLAREAVFIRRR
ncbi:MAG: hypothetical protein M1548_00670 [Actinobacteria bacterium]|nr:hypothetical protein [Actinomycetota bacterium]